MAEIQANLKDERRRVGSSRIAWSLVRAGGAGGMAGWGRADLGWERGDVVGSFSGSDGRWEGRGDEVPEVVMGVVPMEVDELMPRVISQSKSSGLM